MGNPIDPQTGKPFRGREPKEGWDAKIAERIGSETGEIGNGETDSGSGNKTGGWWSFGNRSIDREEGNDRTGGDDNTEYSETGSDKTAEGLGSHRVTVEGPTEKPKRTYTKRGSTKGPITAKDFEHYIVLGFSVAATLQNRPWWNITEPETEVEPFSDQGAALLNRVLKDYAQQVKDGGDVASVAFGMFALIYKRVQLDAQVRLQYARQRKEQMEQEEGTPNANAYTDSTEATYTHNSNGRTASTGYSGGARPVRPENSIFTGETRLT